MPAARRLSPYFPPEHQLLPVNQFRDAAAAPGRRKAAESPVVLLPRCTRPEPVLLTSVWLKHAVRQVPAARRLPPYFPPEHRLLPVNQFRDAAAVPGRVKAAESPVVLLPRCTRPEPVLLTSVWLKHAV